MITRCLPMLFSFLRSFIKDQSYTTFYEWGVVVLLTRCRNKLARFKLTNFSALVYSIRARLD